MSRMFERLKQCKENIWTVDRLENKHRNQSTGEEVCKCSLDIQMIQILSSFSKICFVWRGVFYCSGFILPSWPVYGIKNKYFCLWHLGGDTCAAAVIHIQAAVPGRPQREEVETAWWHSVSGNWTQVQMLKSTEQLGPYLTCRIWL